MMTTQEFRLINAEGIENLQSCTKEITKVLTQVNPKDYQCIAMDSYIIFQGNYHPDGIVTYKIPRKDTNYEFDKFPKEYQEEVQKLQKELNLTKKQVNELHKSFKSINVQINNLENGLKILRNNAKQIKINKNMENQINNFFKTYEKFSECLTSDLALYDPETKKIIKTELTKLIHLIEVIGKSLN